MINSLYSKKTFKKGNNITKFDSQDCDIKKVLKVFQENGAFIVEKVFNKEFISTLEKSMYSTHDKIINDIGLKKLKSAGEMGVLRAPMFYDSNFLEILNNKVIIDLVDNLLSDNAILHLQNGFILPSYKSFEDTPKKFQNTFHMDFKRVLNGYPCSFNILLLVSDFNEENGGTRVVPNSHQLSSTPNLVDLEQNSTFVEAKSGSILVFDSTLWHSAGSNISGKDRMGVNHQFTRSYFKQQIDYVRTMGEHKIKELPKKTQQFLGWNSRIPTCLQEYYVSPEERFYKANQD